MKKLYKVKLECETYFIADETDDINKLAYIYLSEEYHADLVPTRKDDFPIEISEINSLTQISDRWKKGQFLAWGTDIDISPQQWLLKAFL